MPTPNRPSVKLDPQQDVSIIELDAYFEALHDEHTEANPSQWADWSSGSYSTPYTRDNNRSNIGFHEPLPQRKKKDRGWMTRARDLLRRRRPKTR